MVLSGVTCGLCLEIALNRDAWTADDLDSDVYAPPSSRWHSTGTKELDDKRMFEYLRPPRRFISWAGFW